MDKHSDGLTDLQLRRNLDTTHLKVVAEALETGEASQEKNEV
jgi:hypothetical protein